MEGPASDWPALFLSYRVLVVRHDEVVQGVLLPELGPEDRPVREALATWPGTYYMQKTADGTELTLIRRLAAPPRERWWLHVLLFALTALTTTAAGARFQGSEPIPLTWFSFGDFALRLPATIEPSALLPGLIFSVPLLGILLGHELGHYVLARRHGMDVSPPYFLPSPRVNVIGTFGAFIRLRSAMINRAMLLDVGVAGPIASFLLSIPVLVLGLMWSEPALYGGGSPPTPLAVMIGNHALFLGDSFFFRAIAWFVVEPAELIVLHPLAFAGWLGLFVTALNLFPLSQLDGGHILYALVREWQPRIGLGFLLVLLLLGNLWWGWWFWAVLILLLGRGTIRHPAVLDPDFRIGRMRRAIGLFCVFVFVVTFVAVPFRI